MAASDREQVASKSLMVARRSTPLVRLVLEHIIPFRGHIFVYCSLLYLFKGRGRTPEENNSLKGGEESNKKEQVLHIHITFFSPHFKEL